MESGALFVVEMQNVNKATADALCAEVTGERNLFALVYGTAGSSGLPYVKRTVSIMLLCVSIIIQVYMSIAKT